MTAFGSAGVGDKVIVEEDWNNLKESSSNLNFGHRGSRIRMSFKSLQREAQRLSSKANKPPVSTTQIKEFAAKAGVNIQDQQQYIASIVTAASSSSSVAARGGKSVFGVDDGFRGKPLKLQYPTNTIDLRNFLKEHHSFIISSTIRECQEQSAITFQKNYENSMEEEWDCDKRDILHFLEHGIDDIQENQQSLMNLSLLNYPEFVENRP